MAGPIDGEAAVVAPKLKPTVWVLVGVAVVAESLDRGPETAPKVKVFVGVCAELKGAVGAMVGGKSDGVEALSCEADVIVAPLLCAPVLKTPKELV